MKALAGATQTESVDLVGVITLGGGSDHRWVLPLGTSGALARVRG
jgi:hypothetical protein